MADKVTVRFDLIECETGWQVECCPFGDWTLYSKVYPSESDAEIEASRFCRRMGWSHIINERTAQGVKSRK